MTDLQAAKPENQPAHGHQALEGKLDADQEQEEHDAEFAERAQFLGIGEAEIVEPGKVCGKAAQHIGADQDADDQKAQDVLMPSCGRNGTTTPAAPRMIRNFLIVR